MITSRIKVVSEFKLILKGLTKMLEANMITIGLEGGIKTNTNLIKSFGIELKSDYTAIQFIANDYMEYLDRGRKPFGKKVPIHALVKWIKKYNIRSTTKQMTTNQLAFAIQTNIYKYGIKARDILSTMSESMVNSIEEEMSKRMEQSIADEFENTFIKN